MRSASQSFLPRPESVAAARRFARAVLASWGVDPIEDDVRSVVSELATNALLHARTEFALTLSLSGERLRVTVADRAAGRPRIRRSGGAESTTGRGLSLIACLSQEWGVEVEDGGKAVWCTFDTRTRPGGLDPDRCDPVAEPADGTGDPDLDVAALLAGYTDRTQWEAA